MKSISYKFMMAALAVLFAVAVSGCDRDNKEPEIKPELATITYTYSVSPEMLNYFDITAWYTNVDGERESRRMTTPEISIYTEAMAFASERFLTFTVTRKGNAAPAETPQWTTDINIDVEVRMNNGVIKNYNSHQSNTYSPTPAKFDSWAESFIVRMGVGYETYITYNGNVNFSTN